MSNLKNYDDKSDPKKPRNKQSNPLSDKAINVC